MCASQTYVGKYSTSCVRNQKNIPAPLLKNVQTPGNISRFEEFLAARIITVKWAYTLKLYCCVLNQKNLPALLQICSNSLEYKQIKGIP